MSKAAKSITLRFRQLRMNHTQTCYLRKFSTTNARLRQSSPLLKYTKH